MTLHRSMIVLLCSLCCTSPLTASTGAADEPAPDTNPSFSKFLPPDPGWQTLSLTWLDVDGDGAPEPVGGEVGPDQKFRVRVGRGSILTSCFPAARQKPELPRAPLPVRLRPDILRAADVDADGHRDLVVAERGADHVLWYAGPISEAARPAGAFELPGRLRLIETADIDRRDGLDDLLIAVEHDHGSDLLVVLRSPLGAAQAQPELLSFPSPITRLSWGRIAKPEDPRVIDLWIEADSQPWLVAGRWTTPRQTPAAARQPILWLTGQDPTTWEAPPNKLAGSDAQPRRAAFRVNSSLDGSDGDPGDGICEISPLDPSGICTLRAAVEQANATPGPDSIEFALPGFGPFELMVSGPAPIEITEAVSIDGTTQAGYAGTPIVELAFAGGGILPGLLVVGDDVLICGLSITGFPGEGVAIEGNRVVLEGNWIGIDPTVTAVGNLRGIGISGNDARIGGAAPGAGNVISSNTTGGISLAVAANDNEVIGNRIGTDPDGLIEMANSGPGVFVGGNANTIGGTGFREGNLISGNVSVGVWLDSNSNLVQRNIIGSDPGRILPLGNSIAGIFVAEAADGQLIGGASGGNYIHATQDAGGVGGSGIVIQGSEATVVQSNLIGGTGALGNELHGVHVEKPGLVTPRGGVIGGSSALGNVIGGNGVGGIGHGVLLDGAEDYLIAGNRIGTGFFGFGVFGNSGDGVRLVESSEITVGGLPPIGAFNAIFHNGGNGIGVHDLDSSSGGQNTQGNDLAINLLRDNGALGIDLTLGGPVADGPTANDDDDIDFGPNRLQNFPLLDPAERSGGMTTIDGTLSAAPSTTYSLQFYDNPECDPSGFGEAHTLLDALDVTTNAAGEATFTFTTSRFVTFPTATATHATTRDTSELSPCPATLPGGDGFLGDRVWQDLDGDGQQALEEPGIAGVTVRLLDAATLTKLAQTVTDADGIYRFTGITTGSYRIAVEAPDGALFVPPNVGDDALDSDIDPATGTTDAFTYTAGTVDLDQDAGLDVPIFSDNFETGDTSRWN